MGSNIAPASARAPQLTYSIGEAASLIGVSAHMLRAWERRYDLPPPSRTDSGQRRYTAGQIEHLRTVRQLVVTRGLPVPAAVELARQRAAAEPSSSGTPRQGEPLPAVPNDLWSDVLDLVPELVLVLDRSGRIVTANVVLAKLLRTTRERLPGLQFGDLVEPHDRAKAVTLYRGPPVPHRDWELNLRAGSLGLYAFDCWPLDTEPPLLALLGHPVRSQARSQEAPWAGAAREVG
jgi:DNA-binding transcriptional MerR regulator